MGEFKDVQKLNEKAEEAFERIKRKKFGIRSQTGQVSSQRENKVNTPQSLEEAMKKEKKLKEIMERSNPIPFEGGNFVDQTFVQEAGILDILAYLDNSPLSNNIKAAIGLLIANEGKEDIKKAIFYLEKEI